MLNLSNIAKSAVKILRDNSPAILTALGVSGALTTAYLAAKASFKAARVIDREEERRGTAGDRKQRIKERTKLVWKLYIPTGISGVITVGCIIGGARIGSKRTAAAYSVLTVTEKAFTEYKEKVVEQIGEKKEQAIHDAIAQDHVTKTSGQGMVVIGSGDVLCYEMHTGRYFHADMEKLRRAQNDINARLISNDEASLSDFYYMIGLPPTSYSGRSGWNSYRMMELSFSTVMSEDNRPCISFEYNYVIPF